MRLAWFIALRFLREGRAQSALILAGVTVGVGVLVFLSALISGLQASLIRQTLGSQPHVVVKPPEEAVRPQLPAGSGDSLLLRRIERPSQRERSIDGWPQQMRVVQAQPGVVAVSPLVSGAGLASHGNAQRAVVVMGIRPELFEAVIPLRARIVAGALSVEGEGVVVGARLAEELGVSLGERLRVEAGKGRTQLLRIEGIFDLGNRDVNGRWLVVSMRNAQNLLDLSGGVSHLEVRVREVFQADTVASRIARATGLTADSWIQLNAQLMTALRSQSSSSNLIQVFVLLAVAMGIASVLVVSVIQKSREIGILRAMGASRDLILQVFLLEGGLVGFVGSLLGSVLGALLARLFAGLATNPDGSPTFPVDLSVSRFAAAVAIATMTGLLSALSPARRAARLDPAVAIRNL